MSCSLLIQILTCAVCTSALNTDLEIHYLQACFDSGDALLQMTINGDEAGYVDFGTKTAVWTIPHFNHEPYDAHVYIHAEISRNTCKSRLQDWERHDIVLPKAEVAPDSTIYSRDEVVFGERNTLICLVKDFYPPSINVTWTKNSLEVTEGVKLSQHFYNRDGTFYSFAFLSFLPEVGDVYTCTTMHEALESPITRTWEMHNTNSSMVFIGVCLTIGLLGVVIGTFLLVKQHNIH